MSLEHTDAARKAARGRKAAVGRFLAIINTSGETLVREDEFLEADALSSDSVEISFSEEEHGGRPWRPLLDILTPATARH